METITTESTIEHYARSQRIIYHATQAFLTRGYAGTLLDDIACNASVSKLTLYRLFGSKLDLAAAVLQSIADMLEADCGRALEMDGPVDEYLEGVGVSYLRWLTRPIGKCRVYEQIRLFTELTTICPEYALEYEKIIKKILCTRMKKYLDFKVDSGELMPLGARFILYHFFDTLLVSHNVILKNKSGFDALLQSDFEHIVRGNVQLLLYGCAPRPEQHSARQRTEKDHLAEQAA